MRKELPGLNFSEGKQEEWGLGKRRDGGALGEVEGGETLIWTDCNREE